MNELKIYPRNKVEAAEDMLAFISSAPVKPLEDPKTGPMEFATWIHRHYGPFFRNTWALWWHQGHGTAVWPEEKPDLIDDFHKDGITNADDMVVLVAVVAWGIYHKVAISYDFYRRQCIEHWMKHGYPDGLWDRKPPRGTGYDGS